VSNFPLLICLLTREGEGLFFLFVVNNFVVAALRSSFYGLACVLDSYLTKEFI